MEELKLLGKVPAKKLFYGFLIKRHAKKANKYGSLFPFLLAYHKDMAHYYYFKAYGEYPKL